MRVCLIGDFSTHLDEGFKNVAWYLARSLSRGHDLVRVNLKQPFGPELWSSQSPGPDVVHYLSAPTVLTFALLALIRLRWPGVSTVVSALHPSSLGLENSATFRWLVAVSRPDFVLVQNPRSAEMFRRLGCRVRYLPNGVDTERFFPATKGRRERLRRKHGLPEDQYVVLHVGHLRQERNIELMSQVQADDAQVVIVGGTYLGEDRQLIHRLEGQGCIVWRGYYPRIEEVYALADAFVFPTSLGGSLFMPLSVMEAMASDLPVVSTPFEGLVHYFHDTSGLIFASQDEVPRALRRWRRNGLTAGTRDRVEAFSWGQVASRLEGVYREIASGR